MANDYIPRPDALFHPGSFWHGALTRVEGIFSDDPTVTFVVPAFVWFLVALRGVAWTSPETSTGAKESVT